MRATFEGPAADSTAHTGDDPSPAPQALRAAGIEHGARPPYKPRNSGKLKGKGKGKATQWDSDDDDDDDDAYVTSTDYDAPSRNANAGFGDVGADDDDLYG